MMRPTRHIRILSGFLIASAVAWTPLAATADLTRLAYHHPGLVVDLGVGLWVWPLPMDYDGDGDLDLVAFCPDKPYNGTYLFENPGDGEKMGHKMPVFKRAVRLGQGHRHARISFVHNEPRILVPGHELVGFRGEGFGQPSEIYPITIMQDGATRANQWTFVDYDGDGVHDLIVGAGDWSRYGWDNAYDSHGNWRNDRLHGYVYLLRNAGTDDEPRYEPKRRVQAGGADVDVFGQSK